MRAASVAYCILFETRSNAVFSCHVVGVMVWPSVWDRCIARVHPPEFEVAMIS